MLPTNIVTQYNFVATALQARFRPKSLGKFCSIPETKHIIILNLSTKLQPYVTLVKLDARVTQVCATNFEMFTVTCFNCATP